MLAASLHVAAIVGAGVVVVAVDDFAAALPSHAGVVRSALAAVIAGKSCMRQFVTGRARCTEAGDAGRSLVRTDVAAHAIEIDFARRAIGLGARGDRVGRCRTRDGRDLHPAVISTGTNEQTGSDRCHACEDQIDLHRILRGASNAPYRTSLKQSHHIVRVNVGLEKLPYEPFLVKSRNYKFFNILNKKRPSDIQTWEFRRTTALT